MLRVILLAILLMVVARLVWRIIDAVIAGARSPAAGSHPAVKLVRDPVCGTYVQPQATLSVTSAGSTHYFCSEQCKSVFRRSGGA
jgi:YHS domain-containing protein